MEAIKKLNPDILCIQETKAQDDEVTKALSQLSNQNIYVNSAEKKGYSGIVTLSKTKPVKVVNDMDVDRHDNEGRVIYVEYSEFYLVNVCAPNYGQQLERLEYRKQWATDFLDYFLISKSLKAKVKSFKILSEYHVSDHCPIVLEINF